LRTEKQRQLVKDNYLIRAKFNESMITSIVVIASTHDVVRMLFFDWFSVSLALYY